jgi:uncharacterized membrane protein
MVLASALDIFSRSGFSYLSRWSHVFVGITWIGLLYFFNFVQVPAYAEMEAAARNNAIDKLTSRALWWFRWAAAATLVSGILLIIFNEQYESDFIKSPGGVAIYAGVLLALTMFLNVWLVIWPNQKKVIANARNVQAGGEADPAVPPAARKAALASRQNTIFSLPMLFFMIGTAHFFGGYDTSDNRAVYWAITLVVLWLPLELNALGVFGRAAGAVNTWIYDDHRRAIGAGLVLVVVWYALWEIFFT